jgi:transcriptional regulator with XRE-family HTH domain
MPRILKFDFPRFYRALNERRALRGASWRQVAREVGIGKSTLARMAQDKRPDADGLAALAAWAGINPGEFVYKAEPPIPPALRTDSRPSV